jgi:hypothetical protein
MYVNNGFFPLIFTFVIIIIISVLRIRRSNQGTKVNVKKTTSVAAGAATTATPTTAASAYITSTAASAYITSTEWPSVE